MEKTASYFLLFPFLVLTQLSNGKDFFAIQLTSWAKTPGCEPKVPAPSMLKLG